jgi:hypothetical protein
MEEDEAAVVAALSTAVGWNWTAPPHAVAPPLLRSSFDDEDAWKAHCRKRRAQQMALQEKSRAPRDRSNRTRPARVRQQEERRQQRERRHLEQRQLFCETSLAQDVGAADQQIPSPPLAVLPAAASPATAIVAAPPAHAPAGLQPRDHASALSGPHAWACGLHRVNFNDLPPVPAHLQRSAARELQRRVNAQAAAKERRLAKQKERHLAKQNAKGAQPSAGISKEKRWRRVSGPRADGRRVVRS